MDYIFCTVLVLKIKIHILIQTLYNNDVDKYFLPFDRWPRIAWPKVSNRYHEKKIQRTQITQS